MCEPACMKKIIHAQEAAGTPVGVDKRALAQAFCVHPRTVSNWMSEGLPHLKITRRLVRYEIETCRAWLKDKFEVSRIGGAR